MRAKVGKWGNSAAVRVPAPLLEVSGLGIDEAVEMRAEGGRIVIERPFQRRTEPSGKPPVVERGSQAWKLAEVMARAADILGSEDEGRRWLVRPAMALDGRRPIDLLGDPAGEERVDDLLTRMDHGVYT